MSSQDELLGLHRKVDYIILDVTEGDGALCDLKVVKVSDANGNSAMLDVAPLHQIMM